MLANSETQSLLFLFRYNEDQTKESCFYSIIELDLPAVDVVRPARSLLRQHVYGIARANFVANAFLNLARAISRRADEYLFNTRIGIAVVCRRPLAMVIQERFNYIQNRLSLVNVFWRFNIHSGRRFLKLKRLMLSVQHSQEGCKLRK